MSDIPSELKGVEAALTDLVPRAALERDRFLFEAGRRSARSRGWPLATMVFAGLTCVLGLRVAFFEPTPRVMEIVKHEPAAPPAQHRVEPITAEAAESIPPTWGHAYESRLGYLAVRDRAVHFGVESTAPMIEPPSRPSIDGPINRRLLMPLI